VWAARVSPVTATLAERLITAGMIVIGKTHTVEFAMGSWGTNTHMGTPRNPWDLAVHRTPGGSSSGSGVAVGAGLAPAAIGTDTGGSVRLPAAWCGTVGLKVTAGRISTFGVLPLSFTLDTPGPLTRSVEDAALIFRALNGPDPRDPQTLAWTAADPMPSLRRGVAGLRLAAMPDGEREGVDKEVLAAYDGALDALAGLGARIVRPALPHRFADYAAATGRIIGAEGYRFVGHLVAEALADVDALITPTAQTAAIPIDQADQKGTAAHFTRPMNYLGRCALALPNGFTAGGLPTSMQIVCAPGEEALALRIGWAYEAATPWKERRPPEPAAR
jgi:aspartyl-tRNA(Asn)/glutamyl-tRNA(Gln) amidotransferase subunit A